MGSAAIAVELFTNVPQYKNTNIANFVLVVPLENNCPGQLFSNGTTKTKLATPDGEYNLEPWNEILSYPQIYDFTFTDIKECNVEVGCDHAEDCLVYDHNLEIRNAVMRQYGTLR